MNRQRYPQFKSLRTLGLTLLGAVALVATTVNAADSIPGPESNAHRATQVRLFGLNWNGLIGTLNNFWEKVSTVLFTFLTSIAVIYLILAGLQYITSRGNPEATKKARQQIISIVYGIAILVAAYAIVNALVSAANWLVPG